MHDRGESGAIRRRGRRVGRSSEKRRPRTGCDRCFRCIADAHGGDAHLSGAGESIPGNPAQGPGVLPAKPGARAAGGQGVRLRGMVSWRKRQIRVARRQASGRGEMTVSAAPCECDRRRGGFETRKRRFGVIRRSFWCSDQLRAWWPRRIRWPYGRHRRANAQDSSRGSCCRR